MRKLTHFNQIAVDQIAIDLSQLQFDRNLTAI